MLKLLLEDLSRPLLGLFPLLLLHRLLGVRHQLREYLEDLCIRKEWNPRPRSAGCRAPEAR
jgi:hypothetical protein